MPPAKSHATRRPHPGRAIALALCLFGTALSLGGCGGGESEAGASGGATSTAGSTPTEGAPATALVIDDSHRARAEELLVVLTPPPPEDVESQNNWVDARRDLMLVAHLEAPEVGAVLLERVQSGELDRTATRGALEAAALCAPQHCVPYLVELVDDTSADLGVRETATSVLGRVDPRAAIDTLEVLVRDRPRGTYPPGESILNGWLTAKRALGEDPVPILALVATDIYQDEATRHRSLRILGEEATPLAQEALREVLIESTGNGYLRRLAAQSVVKAFPTEEACAILHEVALREADVTMQMFLGNLVDTNCP